MRVVIEARLESGASGGVETVILGLAAGLSTLTDADDEYLFLTLEGHDEWLRPHLHGPCRAVPVAPTRQGEPISPLRAVAKKVPGFRAAYRLVRPARYAPQPSDGTAEGLGADVMHFPHQAGFITSIPSVYQPHDLQHLHLPQFFSREQFSAREAVYRTLCQQATVVVVASNWVRDDVIREYGLPPEKVAVVPLAPIIDGYTMPTPEEVARVKADLHIPDRFAFYPAQTWPHKNHLALIEALAELRSRGITVPLVCSGRLTDHQAVVRQRAIELGVQDQIVWTNFVSPQVLRTLYGLATVVVIPTLFEAGSFPIWEAFAVGTPVICSNVTSLPEQVGDGAIVFDPTSPHEIAAAIARVWSEGDLREALVKTARQRLNGLSWATTAKTYRGYYRIVAQAKQT